MSDPHREAQLKDTIENLYKVFAAYPLPSRINSCPCCLTDADNQRLLRTPLRELTSEGLREYADSVLLTWGTECEFKHFLPRVLECLAMDDRCLLCTETFVGRLGEYHGAWRTWPTSEQAALTAFFAAWWRAILVFPCGSRRNDPETFLCAVSFIYDDLSPFLDVWAADDNFVAAQQLAELLHGQGNHILMKGKLENAFWGGESKQMRQVIAWLATPSVHDLLENAFFRLTGEDAEKISIALTIHESLASHKS